MSYEIAHFFIGMAGGAILIYLFPSYFTSLLPGSMLKNDLFIVVGSGLFAMIPDMTKVVSWWPISHSSSLNDIFWGHHYIDYVFDASDNIMNSVFLIAMGIVVLMWYYHKL